MEKCDIYDGTGAQTGRVVKRGTRLTTIILIIYALLMLYSVLAVFTGAGYHPVLTPLNTILAFGFAVLHGSQYLGWKRSLLLLASTFVISLVFESVGVATGWVYGSYHYTEKLGVKFLGLVPFLVPMAWFMMSYPSFIIALRLVTRYRNLWKWRIAVAAIGSLAMTAWDLAMDPMMVSGGHWVWDQPGAYFGIPLQNYWGWWLTIFMAFFFFLVTARITPASLVVRDAAFTRQAIVSYAIMGVSTVLVDIQIGLSGPALVGILAMLPWVLLSWNSNPEAFVNP